MALINSEGPQCFMEKAPFLSCMCASELLCTLQVTYIPLLKVQYLDFPYESIDKSFLENLDCQQNSLKPVRITTAPALKGQVWKMSKCKPL